MAVPLSFEFWGERGYQSYGDAEQQALADAVSRQPPAKDVNFAGGMYVVRNLDQIPSGDTWQVNMRTSFERHVRITPPYNLPGAVGISIPPGGFRFQCQTDGGWHDYPPPMQAELARVLQCAPVPQMTMLGMEGRPYLIQGLDLLAGGAGVSGLVQFNMASKMRRKIRVLAGGTVAMPAAMATPAFVAGPCITAPPPRASNPAPAFTAGGYVPAPPPRLANPGMAPGRGGQPAGKGGQIPEILPGGEPFSAKSVRFCVCPAQRPSSSPQRGAAKPRPLAAEAQALMCEVCRQDPRPSSVKLPSGHVVEGLADLESGGANLRDGKDQLVLLLEVPVPAPGELSLPDGLDSDDGVHLASCGRPASLEELAALPIAPTSGDLRPECAICRCGMEEQGGAPVSPGASKVRRTSEPEAAAAPPEEAPPEAPPEAGGEAEDEADGSDGAFVLSCGHIYHRSCLESWFGHKRKCPECQQAFGKTFGEQPSIGQMRWRTEGFRLPGVDAGASIIIEFSFPPGQDKAGKDHEGRRERGYLPMNAEGVVLLELYKVAFRRCVMFGLGDSMTNGVYRPTYNIHIKTSSRREGAAHGFPDPAYFRRSLDELKANGVTVADLPL